MTEESMDSADNNDGSLSDISGSAETPGSASSTLSPFSNRTLPNCNRCKNHNVTAKLKGHKRYCEFRDCVCKPCLLTVEKRKVMAAQTRQKRAQVQDERAGVPLERRAPVLPPAVEATVDWIINSPAASIPLSPPHKTAKVVSNERKYEDILESQREASFRLVQEFGVTSTALPFALVICKTAGDFKLAKNIILDAQNEIREKSLMVASMIYERPSIFSHGPNYMPEAHSYSVPFTPYRPFGDGGGSLGSSPRLRTPPLRN